MSSSPARLAGCAAVVMILIGTTGCVQSRRSAYAHHLSTIVPPLPPGDYVATGAFHDTPVAAAGDDAER